MFTRLRSFLTAQKTAGHILEAALIGLFFVQALRLLIGLLYSRIAGATVSTDQIVSGAINSPVIDPAIVGREVALLGLVIALPALTLILGRVRGLMLIAILAAAGGRLLINVDNRLITQTMAAEITVAAGLVYIALILRWRMVTFPYLFVLGLGLDQILRAAGNTLDPSWWPSYAPVQASLSLLAILIGIINARSDQNPQSVTSGPTRIQGKISFWSGLALGGLLFLQLSLLSLPNAVAGRSGGDYTLLVPLLIAATLLPIVPAVRSGLRHLIAPFDSSIRTWVWMLFIILMMIVGLRVGSISTDLTAIGIGPARIPLGSLALVMAQLASSSLWWWLVRPRAHTGRDLSGLWAMTAALVFSVLLIFDLLSYEYAFVRDFAAPLDLLNPWLPSLLRGFRGMGLAIIVLAVVLSVLPMLQTSSRIAWTGHSGRSSLPPLLIVIASSALGAHLARPPLTTAVLNEAELRVGTYNIHAGFSEYFTLELEGIAQAIQQSGADVVLLQEVDAGRLGSFGVDQSLWLARRLGMDRRFFGTDEGLYGLATLSRVPIVFDDGMLLSSTGQQTGLQRVQIRPDAGVLTLYNTWLSMLLAGDSIEEQERHQRQQLAEIFQALQTHVERDYGGQLGRALLGGTFNNVPDSPLMRSIDENGFSDPFAGSNLELAATLVRAQDRARVDYLWLWEAGLQSTGNGVISSAASDHRLAFASVLIRRGGS